MESIIYVIDWLRDRLWDVPTMVLLLGTGLVLTVMLRGIQFRRLGEGFRRLFQKGEGRGDVSPFASLCMALSACVGTGNIVGVAIAITLGGPGALVWMVIAALIGMATMYAEATMAVKYRKVDRNGQILGGPFYYIEKGTGVKWLSCFFAVACMLAAALGIGSLSQIGSIVSAVNGLTAGTPGFVVWGSRLTWAAFILGCLAVVSAGFVIIGGVQSIARWASRLVPAMAGLYILGGLITIGANLSSLPNALMQIVNSAFSVRAAAGGIGGGTLMLAMRHGIARGVFSNEAGLGSNPIAAAAARCKKPCYQGVVSMIGVFIDTVLICTMTGLVIVITGAHEQGLTGAAVTTYAFSQGLGFAPSLGAVVVNGGLLVFAYTTILGWCYYGERSCAYLFGEKSVLTYKCFYIGVLFMGIFLELGLIISLADVLNALMIIPNLIGILALLGTIQKESAEYLPRRK